MSLAHSHKKIIISAYFYEIIYFVRHFLRLVAAQCHPSLPVKHTKVRLSVGEA